MSELTTGQLKQLSDILLKIKDYRQAVHDIVLDMHKDIKEYEETMRKIIEANR